MRNLSSPFRMMVLSRFVAGGLHQRDHERPVMSARQRNPAATLPQANEDMIAALVEWRDVFPDPELRAVIETALVNNRNLRVAVLNVERAARCTGSSDQKACPRSPPEEIIPGSVSAKTPPLSERAASA
ncbi:MAG: hypothetical protein R3C40_02380 [Parvularculaceae bacterium]